METGRHATVITPSRRQPTARPCNPTGRFGKLAENCSAWMAGKTGVVRGWARP
jgi:hypothetical protein